MANSAINNLLVGGVTSGLVKLDTQTVSGASTVNFDNLLNGDYDSYKIFATGVTPSTDGSLFYFRVGTGSTPTYQSGAGAYGWTQRAWPLSDDISNSATQIQLFGDDGVGNAAGESASYEITIHKPSDTSINTNIAWEGVVNDNGSTAVSSYSIGSGTYLSTTAVTSAQLLFSAGNISGTFTLYGVSKSGTTSGGGGGIILLDTQTAAASSVINFNNALSSTYDNYLIKVSNLVPATNGAYLTMQVGTGATPTYQTTGYLGSDFDWTSSGGAARATLTTAHQLQSSSNTPSSTSTNAGQVDIEMSNINSSNYKPCTARSQYIFSGGALSVGMVYTGQWQGAAVLTSIRFSMSSGNIATGTFSLYGYVN